MTEPSFSFPDVQFSSWQDLTLLDAAASNQAFSNGISGPESVIDVPQNPYLQEYGQQAIEMNLQETASEVDRKTQRHSQFLLSKSTKAREEDSSAANSTPAIHSSTKKRKQTQQSLNLEAEESSHSDYEDAFEENSKQTRMGTKKSKSSASLDQTTLKPATPEQRKAAQQEFLDGKKGATQIVREYAQKGIHIPRSTIAFPTQAKKRASLSLAKPEELEAAKKAVIDGQGTPVEVSKQYAVQGVYIPSETLRQAKKRASLSPAKPEELEAAKEAVIEGKGTPAEISKQWAAKGVNISAKVLTQAKKGVDISRQVLETAKKRASLREASKDELRAAKLAVISGQSTAVEVSKQYAEQGVNISTAALRQAKKRASLREATADELAAAKKAVIDGQGTPVEVSNQYAEQGVHIPSETLRKAKKRASLREATAEELEAAKEAAITCQNTPAAIRKLYAKQGVEISKEFLELAKKQAVFREPTKEEFETAIQAIKNGEGSPAEIFSKYAADRIKMPIDLLNQYKKPKR